MAWQPFSGARSGGAMKLVLGIAILGLAATAAAAAGPSPDATVAWTTPKPVEPFAQCFAHAQEQAGMAWWFVPRTDGGGTFSNAGAGGVRDPYFVDIMDNGATRAIRLTSANAAVLRAVNRCV